MFGFLLYNICAACRGSSFVPIAHRPSFIVHLSRSEAVTLSYSFVLELHSNQVLQSSATIKCYNDLPRQRKRKTRDLKMPVQGVHQKLESIGTTGATIEQLQPRDTVLIADIRIYAAIAVGKAIENVYKRHLQQSPALQDVLVSNAGIAASATPLIKTTLQQWTLLDHTRVRKMIVFDGEQASHGEGPLREPRYRVELDKTLHFLTLPPAPADAATDQIGSMLKTANGAPQESFPYRNDSQRVPTNTKTWKTMAKARLMVSVAGMKAADVFIDSDDYRNITRVRSHLWSTCFTMRWHRSSAR